MKFKNKIIGLGVGVVLTSGLIIAIPKLHTLSKVHANTETQQMTNQRNTNPTVKLALQEFLNLEDFNKQFSEEADERWLVPDLSSLGSEDGGRTHGWTITASKEVFLQETMLQEEPQEYIDGASVGDIRKALIERDAESK
jgi:hypothetical protein